jgi:hypothetical protein
MKQRLQRFFAFHEPTQLAVVDNWLANWNGKHEEMMKQLILFHGPEPPMTYSTSSDRASMVLSRRQILLRECRGLLQQLILYYSPQDVGRVDEVMTMFEGHEEDLFKRLELFAARRDGLFRYFQKNDPHHMDHAVLLSIEWLGSEAHLIRYLAANNGQAPTRSLPFPKLTIPESQRVAVAREKLVEYLRKVQPDRLADADAMLEAYRSREEEMFGMLHGKHGAPPQSSSTSAIGGPRRTDFITSDFVWCVQLLAENWLADKPSQIEEVEDALGKLVGTSITPGEVLLRLAAQTGGSSSET